MRKFATNSQNWPKFCGLCAKKGHWLEKSTPSPVVTNMRYEIVQTKNVKGRRAITLFNTSSGDIDTYFISFFNFLSNLKISAIESIVN